MGTKYTIEVEDKPFELLSEDGFTSEKLFRVKGFNSLVFDWNGLNKLTPYTEPDLEQVRKEAYERGAEDMRKALRLLIDCDDDCLTIPDIFKTFREGSYHAVVRKHPAMEIIEKIRQYEQEKEEIHVGDEVKGMGETGEEHFGIVTRKDECQLIDMYHIVWSDGKFGHFSNNEVEKTGRHFDEITTVLQKMQKVMGK